MISRYAIAIVMLAVAFALASASQPQPVLYSVNMTVYPDGSVLVSQVWYVVSQRAFLALNGSSSSSLVLVYGYNGTKPVQPLPFNYTAGGVSVDSEGYIKVGVLYSSNAMTSKYGDVWSIYWDFSAPVRVRLPGGAQLTSWSSTPVSISTVNDSVLVLMPAGASSLNYTIPEVPGYVIGTVYPAATAFVDGRAVSKGTSFNLTLLPGQYELTLSAPGYFARSVNVTVGPGQVIILKPIRLGSMVKQLQLSVLSSSAQVGQPVELKAEATSYNGSPVSGQPIDFFVNGSRVGENDTGAQGVAVLTYRPSSPGNFIVEASLAANSSITSSAELRVSSGFPADYLIAGALVAVVVAFSLVFYWLKGRKRTLPAELDPEERMIVQYLASHGGKAFQSELQGALPIPKTTLWRNVMSLQEKGYVTITKVGGLNLVTLTKKGRASKSLRDRP
ncbi:PEGA domain-containing protein [Tardisphaera miroshnichenkoae]